MQLRPCVAGRHAPGGGRGGLRRAGFELDRAARGFSISGGDDLAAAQRGLPEELRKRIAARQVDIVVAPSPARDAVEACGDRAPRLWLWGLWADLPWPTLYVGFDQSRLDEAVHMLEAHASQLARNDYRQVVRGRAQANRALGGERVFGYGSAASGQHPFAEVLTEAVLRHGQCGRTQPADSTHEIHSPIPRPPPR